LHDANNPYKLKKSFTYKNFIKKFKGAAIAAIAATAILTAGVTSYANETLTTVYYVYVDDQYAGTVSDKEAIEKLAEEKLEASKASYGDLSLSLGTKISYVPEHVFQSDLKVNNAQVEKKVSEELNVQAEATALVIDGKQVAFVESEDQANQVIKQLKTKYVSEETLNSVEDIKAANPEDLPPLKENETRILDVHLSEEIAFANEKADPKNILTVEEAVKLLEKGSLEEAKYKVKEGDVLGKIASAHNLKTKELLAINPGLTDDSLLQIGQELSVTVLKPYVQVIIEKEQFKKETIPFEKEVEETDSMFKGDTKVKQEGKDGERAATYHISEQNGVEVKKDVIKEEILKEPVKNIVLKGTKVIPSRGDGSFIWPTAGGYISSKQGQRWGRLHKGIDIARPSNRTIKAADNGKVVFAGYQRSFGNKIEIDHQNGYKTIYAHLSSIDVKVGQTVSKGSKIGIMGSTGDSTGVHLHFEIYKNGNLQNPLNYVR